MLQITFNGTAYTLDKEQSLAEFLTKLAVDLRYSAIALNRTFIEKSQYAQVILQHKDSIECVTPMQGG